MSLLAHTAAHVDELVARAQAQGRTPCLAAAVLRDGRSLHLAAAGTDPATGAVPGADTQFRIGSITKTMTAVLLLQLRDEGHLSLDDLLYRHLPGTPVGSAITLRQLLGHVSGLQREPDGPWWERHDGGDLDSLLAALTPDKIAYPPHRSYHYSNLAYGLLGGVAQRITGLSWPELVTKRLLEPLGMRRTSYAATEPYVRGYVVHPWTGVLREEPRTDTGAMAPAGQLWSTVEDLAVWAAFLADPDPDVLAPATLAEMCAPVVISDLDAWTTGHGLGLELMRHGERVYVGHGGSMPGYQAHLIVHRPSRTGSVVFGNAYTLHGTRTSELNQRLLSGVLDAEPVRPAPWRAAVLAEPHELEGAWWWMGREFAARYDAVAGELVVSPVTVPATPWRFTTDGADLWRCHSGSNDGELLRVRRDPDGTPVELDIATFLHTRRP
ncbi:serine hydrolase domain-containing protein [Catellatospora sp. KI3]|uniref:serine hydrolase domain-containing protein n=1 Tax=Catellatospora sp. KI3 TaxID=3041620 RepID=UPI0024825DAE|nr:serine hydrolase domain-containing protein [Catellatospora sp. KI3]MDI1465768.1 serine hydrolase domain-containing protein [Catellatospora sp. KI3]